MDRSKLVPSTPLSKEEVHELLNSDSTLLDQAKHLTAIEIQQAINCCGLTSVAYALSALGCPTAVDDMFLQIGVGVDSAVGDGMTLSEIYDSSCRYVAMCNLPLFVECYHFDSHATVEGFKKAALMEAECGIDDLLVLNFHSGIANGYAAGKGGGHFSVLAGLTKDDRVVMADVHGMKYGKFWATPLAQMVGAMGDHDSCGRARGVLRFGRTDCSLVRPVGGLIDTVMDWTSPPKPYKRTSLQKYIPPWDEGLGARNMEGVCAIAAAMRVLGREAESCKYGRIDEIMRGLRESYTWHLNNFLRPSVMVRILEGIRDVGGLKYKVSTVNIGTMTGEKLKAALLDAGAGTEGVVVLVAYDVNIAQGAKIVPEAKGEAAALTHGTSTWSLIAGVDADAKVDEVGVVISAAHHVIVIGRLWRCSMNRLAEAIDKVGWVSSRAEGDCVVTEQKVEQGNGQIIVIDARVV